MKDLVKRLSEEFGPSGYEDRVKALIKEEIAPFLPENVEVSEDAFGSLIVHIPAENKPRLMVSAHMDEVGFMVTGITEKGNLRFGCVGGMDPLILGGKRVVSESGIVGGIMTQPIHLLSAEERTKRTEVRDMYIDIGATDKADAEKYVHVGDYFTFISDFRDLGDGYIKCKALDDRFGCAIMCEMIKAVYNSGKESGFDLWFAFTGREEVGFSGAKCAAERIKPDYGFVIESKAVQDTYGVPAEKRVCSLGDGAIISFMDNSTIYDKDFMNHLIRICEKNNIKYQLNKYISGGNDSSHIQRSVGGVKVGLISAASRYIHSQSDVVKYEDLEAMRDIAVALVTDENPVI